MKAILIFVATIPFFGIPIQLKSQVDSVNVPAEITQARAAILAHQSTFPEDTAGLHQQINAYPIEYRNSMTHTTAFLGEILRTPYEKAYGLLYFISQHIYYDMDSYKVHRIGPYLAEPNTVLARGLGVCAGYANLYNMLADSIGLETQVITGPCHNKELTGYDYPEGHAWIEVYLQNDTLIIDPTWVSSQIERGDTTFSFNLYYYDISPYLLRVTHHTTEGRCFRNYCFDIETFKHNRMRTGGAIIMTYPTMNVLHTCEQLDIFILTYSSETPVWIYVEGEETMAVKMLDLGGGLWYLSTEVPVELARNHNKVFVGYSPHSFRNSPTLQPTSYLYEYRVVEPPRANQASRGTRNRR